ncbi:MAG TPA: hypothetical protein VFI03_05485 [Solirubrobacterales bacterium]|nr:hypothetical protein [Solirubrobacterales bacterium]
MSGGFKRSSRFGLIGVFVVMAAVAAIGLTMGQGEANPKLALGLIFGVIAIFCVLLFAFQRSDLERVASGSSAATSRAAAEGGRQIENPTTMAEPDLWAALAVKPIGAEAVRARSEMWDVSRRSLRLAMIVTLLIFLTVPSIYLFESFLPLLIGGPLIAIVAVYGSIRAIAPGGEMDDGYRRVGIAMEPLGLEVTERPRVNIEMRDPVTPRMGPKVHGALVLEGQRHGRSVAACLGGEERSGASEITVGGASAGFEAKSRDGRVRPTDGAPAAIVAALSSVPNSTRWKRLKIEGGPDGIVVTRKGGEQSDWLCDLWLAEHLASA